MNYNDALNVITKKQSLGIMPGLARISKLLDCMGNPQDSLNIIHIAGTNGKGTVASTIANTLEENGYKVGLFTSPWVIDYREQIQINNEFISENDLSSYVDAYKNYDCTEFELLTAIMYKYFADSKVDYAVVECGMGGSGDATNVEKKNLSVITSVAIDHTGFLGDTIEKIAQEKAGIIKENSICVLYPNKAVEHIFENECKKKNATLIKILDYNDYKINNLKTASMVIEMLNIDCELKLSQLPARQENINGVLVDGGHNLDSAFTLEKAISNSEVALIGMMSDKNVDGYLSLIAPHCKMIITTSPNNPRSMNSSDLKNIALKYCDNVIAIDNPVDAIKFAKGNGLTLVCGSFFLAREVRKELF